MYFNKWTSSYTIIGTLVGGGYNCKRDTVKEIEGSLNGIWIKVTNFVQWLKEQMKTMEEEVCQVPTKKEVLKLYDVCFLHFLILEIKSE